VVAAGGGCEDEAGSGVGATLRASATGDGLEELEDVVVLEDEDEEDDEEVDEDEEDVRELLELLVEVLLVFALILCE
jgi:uncharacterized protein YgfB (UPF0149 family)